MVTLKKSSLRPRRPRQGTQATLPIVPEVIFQRQLVTFAGLCGYLVYHCYDSRKSSGPGFPDLVLVKPPRVIFVELKTMTGRFRPLQVTWLAALSRCPGVESYCWRPADWPLIEKVLRDGKGK